MQNNDLTLHDLGFDNWFRRRADAGGPDGRRVARVIAVHKDGFVIQTETRETPAEVTGKLMFGADSPLDFPTVGDWVLARFLDDDAFAVISDILPRKSLLRRKTAGRKTDFQLIAANIDTAFIMQSLDVNYNPRRLERYVAMALDSRIQPAALLSKSDMVSSEDVRARTDEVRRIHPEILVAAFSNKTGDGLAAVETMLERGKTYCLLGSSGVGKSTLLNKLLGAEIQATRSVREKDGKGKHATTRRELIRLKTGAMVIDTPGMRELGNFGIEDGIETAFQDVENLARSCRFNDCTHRHEAGCAVLAAVQAGEIPEGRFQNYLKLRRESEHYMQSYIEKRKKDKKFGKMCKSIMKNSVKK